MVKLTALYGYPESPEAFEAHYRDVHVPLAQTLPGLVRVETAKVAPSPGADKPAYYRISELWFADMVSLGAALSSSQGKQVSADIEAFATGGVTMCVSVVDEPVLV